MDSKNNNVKQYRSKLSKNTINLRKYAVHSTCRYVAENQECLPFPWRQASILDTIDLM